MYMNRNILFIISVWLLAPLAYAVLQDPTRPDNYIPSGTEKIVGGGFELNAIIIAPDRRIAVINGKTLKVGDIVSGQQVTAIELNSVQLRGPSGNITLFLVVKPGLSITQEGLSRKE